MTENSEDKISELEIVSMTVDITSAFVSNKSVELDQLPEVIRNVYNTLKSLDEKKKPESLAPRKPAISIRRSITPDYIVCLEDGKKLKMLKRHLRAAYGMTPDEYRARWGLAADYPMVAPNYAITRSKFAKQIGLGKKRKS
ncbi:MAG: MucR family transcriptional regulator [Alphaproteobacteria bacterium]|jgi:predicted transcriptional regulator